MLQRTVVVLHMTLSLTLRVFKGMLIYSLWVYKLEGYKLILIADFISIYLD